MFECKPLATSMAEKLSKNVRMEKVDESIHRGLVGSLIYLTNTRQDIVHAIRIVSRFTSELSNAHFTTLKRTLRYIKGTKSLWYFIRDWKRIKALCLY